MLLACKRYLNIILHSPSQSLGATLIEDQVFANNHYIQNGDAYPVGRAISASCVANTSNEPGA
jgi:hypothetical protein